MTGLSLLEIATPAIVAPTQHHSSPPPIEDRRPDSPLDALKLGFMTRQRASLGAHVRHLVGKVRRYIREPGLMLAEWGFAGARIIGTSVAGNTFLKLSRDYELGKQGTVIEVPRDRVIFESVRQQGSYSPEISRFIADGLEMGANHNQKSAVIDIGANSGLVSLQIINMVREPHEYFLFEPLPAHVQAIRHNLSIVSGAVALHLHEVALSGQNGTATFYTERLNFGNSSFLQDSIVNRSEQIVTEVPTRDTTEFFEGFENRFERLFIKSDTQGMDAFILSRIPLCVWRRVDRAAIEILALPEVDPKDVANVLAKCSQFQRRSWDAGMESNASFTEISDFWTSRSGLERNLFLTK